MKKLYLFLIVAALCAIGVSAKTIHVWRNGVKTNVMIQTNDSITFDTQNAPTMRIWSNGDEIYQLELAVDDSITYSHGTTETNNTLCFDYDHWRDVDTINIYEFNDHVWRTVALPWADEVSTTIPSNYRYPNLELHYDSAAQDTVPTWQLAFNTCHNPTLDGVHMFGLWNTYSNVMRIYSYLEELPNPNAAYCFYRVESSSAAFIDRDAMVWMPSDSVIRKGNWNSAALTGVAATPSTTVCNLMPFASLKTDGSEAFAPVFAGWVAFDLPLATGTSSVSEHGTLTFSLEAVESIDAHGTLKLSAALDGTGTGTGKGNSTGKITIPGSNTRKAAAFLTAFGASVSGIGSAITSGISAGHVFEAGGWAGGITQGVGSVASLVGNCLNASQESKEKKYGLDFDTETEYNLQFEFQGTIKGEFDAQLTSTLASTAKPLTITYGKFFEELLARPKTNQARKAQKDNGTNGDKLSLGIWKLKRQPVYYVSNEYTIARDEMDTTDIGTPTEKPTLVSCLDPTSIELELNMDNPFFDANEIDSITLIAYDYVFVDSAYNLSAQPYYDFYGIHQDTVKILQSTGSLDCTAFLLDPNATYKTFTKGDRSYSGVASDSLAANGLGMYNMVYSPAIHANVGEGSSVTVNEISVAVVVEMTFKNGERRLFAERYLPEIIEYDFYHDVSTYLYIANSSAPESINGIPVSCPLFDMQKAKALRILH